MARDEAIAYIASLPDLFAVGMAIGPFSLVMRLMADPITAAAMAGSGVNATDSPEVELLWQCLRIAEAAVSRSVASQMRHGAKAIMVCEPAASTAFISPRQMNAGSHLFEHLVNATCDLCIKALLDEGGCDLIFHNCGELTESMVGALGTDRIRRF